MATKVKLHTNLADRKQKCSNVQIERLKGTGCWIGERESDGESGERAAWRWRKGLGGRFCVQLVGMNMIDWICCRGRLDYPHVERISGTALLCMNIPNKVLQIKRVQPVLRLVKLISNS